MSETRAAAKYGALAGIPVWVAFGVASRNFDIVSVLLFGTVTGGVLGVLAGVGFAKVRGNLPTRSLYVKGVIYSFLVWVILAVPVFPRGLSPEAKPMSVVGGPDLYKEVSLAGMLLWGLLFTYAFSRWSKRSRDSSPSPIARPGITGKRALSVRDILSTFLTIAAVIVSLVQIFILGEFLNGISLAIVVVILLYLTRGKKESDPWY